MNSTSVAVLAVSMVAQWLTATGSIWLTWWAGQSRDAPALRVIAMVLVVVPALLWPFMTLRMSMDQYGSLASRALMFAVVGVGVAVFRALFLIIWAIVSKDPPYLRIGGGVIAFLLIVAAAMQTVGGLMRF